jgi:hypothetical protein
VKRYLYGAVAALLALTACSGERPAAGRGETSAEASAEDGTDGQAAPSPYTPRALRAVLLTSAEIPSGFEVYASTAAQPSSPPADVWEKVRPATCAVLRNPDAEAKRRTVTATARLHRPSDELDLHGLSLAGFTEPDAKARMTALRGALGTCGAIEFENVHGKGPKQARFRAETAPGLGDEALRYSLGSPAFHQRFTVVRVGGVITYVRSDTMFGPGLTDTQRADLTPAPETKLVRAQVAKVERTLR